MDASWETQRRTGSGRVLIDSEDVLPSFAIRDLSIWSLAEDFAKDHYLW